MNKIFVAALMSLTLSLFGGLAMADGPVDMSKITAERPNVIHFTVTCQADLHSCMVECSHGDKWSCFGEATVLSMATHPNYARVLVLYRATCQKGIYASCLAIPQIIQEAKGR